MTTYGTFDDSVPAPSDCELGSSPPKPIQTPRDDVIGSVRVDVTGVIGHVILFNRWSMPIGTLSVPVSDAMEISRRLLQPSWQVDALVDALRADDAWFRHSRECTDCMAGATCNKGLALYHDANGARQSALAPFKESPDV